MAHNILENSRKQSTLVSTQLLNNGSLNAIVSSANQLEKTYTKYTANPQTQGESFTFKIYITGSIYRPLYDHDPDLGTFKDYGYTYSFIFTGSIHQAMIFAKSTCMTGSNFDDDTFIPYLIKIKSLVHKNTIVGGDVRGSKIKWIIPKKDADFNAIHQKVDSLNCEALRESCWDNFETARTLRFDATLEKLKCADYWQYRPI